VSTDDKESGCCASNAITRALKFVIRQIPFVKKREERAHVSAFLDKLESAAESELKQEIKPSTPIERPSQMRHPEE